MEAVRLRRSVRSFMDREIRGEVLEALRQEIEALNRVSGLNMQLCVDEPRAFSGLMARYGQFRLARSYVALVGKKSADLDEKCGYYGEKFVLKATQMGLCTCWVGGTYKKSNVPAQVLEGEALKLVIAIGHGETPRAPRRTKTVEQLSLVQGPAPEWFRRGVEAALLAPTAMNQQKFRLELDGDAVRAVALPGFYAKVDLGIVKCHFEIGAGEARWHWA